MGAFWDAWNKQGAANNADSMAGMQQAQGLAALMKQGHQMQQQQRLQGILADPNLPPEQKRASLIGLMTDPAQASQAMHLIEQEKTARERLTPKGRLYESPIGKLLTDRQAAEARGDVGSIKIIDSAITKHNQTENSTAQEDMGFLLDVKRKGAAATPDEIDKAKFIYQRMVTPKVGADGTIIRPSFDASFNPWANFGASQTAPLAAPMPMTPRTPMPTGPQGPAAFQVPPQVQGARDGDRLRILEDELRMAPNDAALAAEVEAARSGRNYAGLGAGRSQVAAPQPGSPPVDLSGGKKYVREMPDGKGGMVGLTRDGKYEPISMPTGARTDLQKGQVWNEERGAPEWLPNTPQYAKQSNDHAKDKGAIASTAQAVDIATKKIDELLDPKNKDAFNSLFGGYNALATQFLPGKTQDLRAAVDSLKDNLKSAGKELLVNAGGTSIGQITEREWPILQNQIDKLTPLLSEPQAAKVLEEIKTQMLGMKRRVADKYAEEWGDSQFANRKPRTGGATDAWDDKMRRPKGPKDVLSEADRILKGQ